MSVWPRKYATIFDICAALVMPWSVGAEGRAPSAQRVVWLPARSGVGHSDEQARQLSV